MLILLDRASAGLALLAGLALAVLIGLTFVDVGCRYLLSAPILGVQDILEMGMVTVVFFAAPYAWRTGGHIVVDLVPEFRWPALNTARDIGIRLIVGFMFGLLAWLGRVQADEAVLFNEATNMIELSYRPFYLCIMAAGVVHVTVVAVECLHIVTGRSISHPDDPSP